eukprot:TRINITY_DN6420_c0_g4_i1.p1 TRINITY_DN6420_c0_g4~~TRINITY_DN6420_c0_g4_i1.p1  ORF type:complete len:290 (+),score=55.52 TRINITY_DN6420_c0_g4_i1:63-872(+)
MGLNVFCWLCLVGLRADTTIIWFLVPILATLDTTCFIWWVCVVRVALACVQLVGRAVYLVKLLVAAIHSNEDQLEDQTISICFRQISNSVCWRLMLHLQVFGFISSVLMFGLVHAEALVEWIAQCDQKLFGGEPLVEQFLRFVPEYGDQTKIWAWMTLAFLAMKFLEKCFPLDHFTSIHGLDDDAYRCISPNEHSTAELDEVTKLLKTSDVEKSERNCAICLECLSAEQDDGIWLRELQCQHIFHKPCIDPWFKRVKNCPLCRAPVVRR